MAVCNIKNNISRGDTLIEVLFAVAVFSLVAVSSLAIMNKGTETAQRALEITLVRQEIDAQAETLRFLNASYIANPAYIIGDNSNADQWKKIHDFVADNSTGGDVGGFTTGSACSIPTSNVFFLDTKNAKYISPSVSKPILADTYSRVRYNPSLQAQGLWVEAVRVRNTSDSNQSNAGYIDFHIRACWDSPGQSVPVTIGTIVRLYEPL